MPSPLPAYNARAGLSRLDLTDGIRRLAERLLALAEGEPDGRVRVARVYADLFPANTATSANTSLKRLLREINDAAAAQASALRVAIDTDKQVRAADRQVWFEGPTPAPGLAYTGELNAIPPAQLVTDQRGLPAGDLPVIVLLTFNHHETAAVIDRFHGPGQPPIATRNGIVYNLLGDHGGMTVVQRVSRQGEGEAQNAAHDAIADWQPRAIIGVGIAFGINPAKQRIGDVLVSTSIRGYELGRINADDTFDLRSDQPPASPVLLQRFNHLDQTCRTDPDACLTWPTLHLGTLLSGNRLVDNLDYRTSLLKLEKTAVGGEMEAVGIQLAAYRHDVQWIIVKAICDFADGHKGNTNKERDQRRAADHAALVVHAALCLGPLYDSAPAPPTAERGKPSAGPRSTRPPAAGRMGLRDHAAIRNELLIPDGQGRPTTLAKDLEEAQTARDRGVDAMDYLLDWIDTAQAPPLFALLGEYGMGKTVTCQRLAVLLDQRRQQDHTRPLPLYLDLRHLTGLDRRVPTLAEIVEECMARGWDLPADGERYRFTQFQGWIAQGAVVICDGLDEVLVKLKAADGQTFTQELLRLLPSAQARRPTDAADPPDAPAVRLLISCRTHYFRTLRDQKTHFTGQERGEHGASAYRALVLLPLTPEQVRRYLAAALFADGAGSGSGAAGAEAEAQIERILETVRSVHNLTELTQRPYTLRLVAEFIPEIEQDRLAGRPVYGVTLYRRMVRRWLERDGGKHHILPEHKLLLATHLAAHLWQSGAGLLPADGIERWFRAWLKTEPDLLDRYQDVHRDQLDEDLRTATFLVRQDEGPVRSAAGTGEGGGFRFAHTSLLEFFLADYLLMAIRDDAPERWAMPRPSPETLDFLGQLLAEAADPGLLATLGGWRFAYRPDTSEMLLAYALRAYAQGWPEPSLAGIVLTGAHLDEWRFGSAPGAAKGRPALDLSGADFSGCNLRRACFEGVRLTGARLSDSQLAQAEFLYCDCVGADWSGAECSGAIWRHTDLSGGHWTTARGAGPRFLRCTRAVAETTMGTTKTVDGNTSDLAPGATFDRPHLAPTHCLRNSDLSLRTLTGHQGRVTGCAFSPDGTHMMSAGDDGTLRLWDATSGAALLTLTGHRRGVSVCAYAPDGTRLLSAGSEGTLRLWNATNGAALLVLTGHEGDVSACAFSPDGTRLLSAGSDSTLRLWDAASGTALVTLTAHQSEVFACAFTPDGTKLLSAGSDGTLRLWDAAGGAALMTLKGHQAKVSACAFSPDGTRLLSAGRDGTLRLWDAASGAALLTLTGHQETVWACAFAPDGTTLLSAGDDGTLRLWDAASGAALRTLTGHRIGTWNSPIMACAYAPDGVRLLSAGYDGSLRLWDAASGAALRTLTGHWHRIRACAFAPDGTRLLSANEDGTIRLWDTASGEALLTIISHPHWLQACAFAPDGTRLLSASWAVCLWDAASGEALLTLTGHERLLSACAFAPDGVKLLSADYHGTLRLWDAANGAPLLTIAGHQGAVSACAFAPDGTRLLSAGGDGTLRLWDSTTGAALLTLTGHEGGIQACSVDPDGTRLMSAGNDGTLRLWDAADGAALLTLTGHEGGVNACSFAPDGARLLSAGADGTLRLWDAATGASLLTLTSHEGAVHACAFSPDGTRLLSAGADGTLRLWDAATGTLLRIHATGGPGAPGHAVWDPTTNQLIEASGDAWRWLFWVRTGADGWPEPLPLETFGPLPAPTRLRPPVAD